MPRKVERVLSGHLEWGVSCECVSEEQMGVLLAAMTVMGCRNIAWAPLKPVKPERVKTGSTGSKDPERVEAGRKGAAVRTANANKRHRRKTLEELGTQFLASHTGTFQVGQLIAVLKKQGYASSTAAYPVVNRWLKDGVVKRTAPGVYEKLKKAA